jgi:hypothetical protein
MAALITSLKAMHEITLIDTNTEYNPGKLDARRVAFINALE